MPSLRSFLAPIRRLIRPGVGHSIPFQRIDSRFAELGPLPIAPAKSQGTRLEELFDRHVSGHGVWKWRHYFEIYDTFMSRFVGTNARILEIGVYSGGSLDLWRNYFGPNVHITGVDIEPSCSAYQRDGVEIVIGDQGADSFWESLRETTQPFDIVIDDGSHDPAHQATTLKGILPHISPGGVYLCEDIQGATSFAEMIARLSMLMHEIDEMRANPDDLERRLSFAPTELQKRIHSLHIYPMVAVIQKRAAAVNEFVAPMHGTLWQPTEKFSSANPHPVPVADLAASGR